MSHAGFDGDLPIPEIDVALDPTEQIRGSLLGLAVGDALGAPLEFSSRERAGRATAEGLEMRGGGIWQAGEWTDDTAMALCLAESIAERGLLDLEDLCGRYIDWAQSGPKDIGTTTHAALASASNADEARRNARRFHERTGKSAGNGTVMRATPIGLVAVSQDQGSEPARQDALLSHSDPAAGAASAALCGALVALLEEADPLEAATAEAAGHPRLEEAVHAARDGDRETVGRLAASDELGACWTTLGVGLLALCLGVDFEQGVGWAISLGGDTDTNGAVAGALIGCRDGVDSIPPRWLQPVREREQLERAARALAELRTAWSA
jgi:ADP-ribosyl-[dinitrogen reductase] hydrolase